jgi:hypothetical protein
MGCPTALAQVGFAEAMCQRALRQADSAVCRVLLAVHDLWWTAEDQSMNDDDPIPDVAVLIVVLVLGAWAIAAVWS